MKSVYLFLLSILVPALSQAGLMTQTSSYDWGYEITSTYVGQLESNMHEWRYDFNAHPGLVHAIELEVFSSSFDLALFLFDLSETSYNLGPNGPSANPSNPNFNPGGSLYLGDLIAYDAGAGIPNPAGFRDPRLTGNTNSEQMSFFVVPVGTTEDMIRSNDTASMQQLLMAQNSGPDLDYGFDLGLAVSDGINFGGQTFNQSAQTQYPGPESATVSEPGTLLFFMATSLFIGLFRRLKLA